MNAALLLLAVSLGQSQPIDLGAVRERLELLTDGQGHYLAYDPERPYGDHFFTSSDGKAFVQVPVRGGGASGKESWSVSFWDPRVHAGIDGGPSVLMKDSGREYALHCAKESRPLTRVPAEQAKALVAAATFAGRLWTRLPEKLLRDDTGTYYLVDRARTDERRDFRVFVGPRGAMKQVPLKDVVDDSEGMIFATKSGRLRLVFARAGRPEELKWVDGKKSLALTDVPLDNYGNGRLVYMDLGPYSGARLGTPCDDVL